MIPVIEGFDVVKTANGYAVTTIYDLFNLNKPTLLCEFPTKAEAEAHKQLCFESAMQDYQWCKKQGRSFPDND